MVLFILESLGTSELILIGIIALMFLGPRKLPSMARKAGKIMAELRGTASEFKETWQREVNFEEEAKLLDINALGNESADPATIDEPLQAKAEAPQIKEVDPSRFTDLADIKALKTSIATADALSDRDAQLDKKNWL